MADRRQFGGLRRWSLVSPLGCLASHLVGGFLCNRGSGTHGIGLGIGRAILVGAAPHHRPEPSFSDEVVVEPLRALGCHGIVCFSGSDVHVLVLGPDTAIRHMKLLVICTPTDCRTSRLGLTGAASRLFETQCRCSRPGNLSWLFGGGGVRRWKL